MTKIRVRSIKAEFGNETLKFVNKGRIKMRRGRIKMKRGIRWNTVKHGETVLLRKQCCFASSTAYMAVWMMVIMGMLLGIVSFAGADTPQFINYQGRLTEARAPILPGLEQEGLKPF